MPSSGGGAAAGDNSTPELGPVLAALDGDYDYYNYPPVQKTIRGWQDIRQEQLDSKGGPDLKEVLDVGYVNRSATSEQRTRFRRHYLGDNQWPEDEAELQRAVDEYAESAASVAVKVLGLLADGLGAPGAFDEAFGADSLQVQRLTWYPASDLVADRREGEIGSGAHTDYGGVTVLHADGPGLQVLRPDPTSSTVSVTSTCQPQPPPVLSSAAAPSPLSWRCPTAATGSGWRPRPAAWS